MAENTKIEWCDSTFNPVIGCTKISVGPQGACENCYAAVSTPVRAMEIEWGAGKPRHRTSEANWKQPLTWERQHEKFFAEHGRRRRVFCASLADVFDNEWDPQWRADLFRLINSTPNLDWLLLTKRIGNAYSMMEGATASDYYPGLRDAPLPNVWLMSTVANQAEADRDIPKLLATPARVRALSLEPLLGPIDLTALDLGDLYWLNALTGKTRISHDGGMPPAPDFPAIDWVITGSESGPKSKIRSCDLEWVRSLRDQCVAAGVAFHWKQHVVDGKKISNPELDGKKWAEFPTTTSAL